MLQRYRGPLLLVVVLGLAGLQAASAPVALAGTCTPSGRGKCYACSNCRYCKNCAKYGGTCSVCR